MPKVSVIIPAYNQAKYLRDAIDSVLNQTFQDLELIIVDDGSTDETRDIVSSYNHNKITYIYQENQGLSSARNTGIKSSNGSYLAFLDSDDLFLPNIIEDQIIALHNQPTLKVVLCGWNYIDEHGSVIISVIPWEKYPNPDLESLLIGMPYVPTGTLFRRDCFEGIGLFDETLTGGEDWDLFIRLASTNNLMAWTKGILCNYRIHSSNMTRDPDRLTDKIRVLDNFFNSTNSKQVDQETKAMAYSTAFLQITNATYLAFDFERAKNFFSEAIKYNPNLLSIDLPQLIETVKNWILDPRVYDRFLHLKNILNHLPVNLEFIKTEYYRTLFSEIHMDTAFVYYSQQRYRKVPWEIIKSYYYNPRNLKNRGALKILIKSIFRLWRQ